MSNSERFLKRLTFRKEKKRKSFKTKNTTKLITLIFTTQYEIKKFIKIQNLNNLNGKDKNIAHI